VRQTAGMEEEKKGKACGGKYVKQMNMGSSQEGGRSSSERKA